MLEHVTLALVVSDQLVDLLESLLAEVSLLLELDLVLLQLEYLHLEGIRFLPLLLKLHLLVPESFFQVLQLLEIFGVSSAPC